MNRAKLSLMFAFVIAAASASAQTNPANMSASGQVPQMRMNLGDAVVTGFSGVTAPSDAGGQGAQGKNTDKTFINVEAASARIVQIPSPKTRWDASLLATPAAWTVKAGQIGQVFGLAIGARRDAQTAPNLYFAATAAYGLQIVRRNNDGSLERLKAGAPGAQWAPGQFGLALQGGPGAIYVVDGASGAVNLLTNVALNGVPNPGPGLGALAFDAAHKQLFASDLYTGMIHRVGLDGADLGHFDHGVTVRTASQMTPAPFDPGVRMNIASPAFKVDDAGAWGLAPPARRVWALAVQDGRLYYSVQEGLQIWSIGLRQDGDFDADARYETSIPDNPGPYPATDIAFAANGDMVVAQRNAFGAGVYDYSAFTQPGEPRVLRLTRKLPNDPPSPGLWRPATAEYSVGFGGAQRNADGGVALGYGYDRDNRLSLAACGETLFATGDHLRVNPSVQDRLVAGGPAAVDGVQISPASALRDPQFPQPWMSQFVDFDGKQDNPESLGWMGQVRVLTEPCAPPAAMAVAQQGAAPPPYMTPPVVTPPFAPPPPPTDQAGCVGAQCGPYCLGPYCAPDDCGGFVCQPCDFANAPDGACPPPAQPIDLAIKKTGETSRAPNVNAYSFNLAVTSVSGIYNGANVIKVTDTVPPGMTFNTATGTNWTCATLPATAGQTITCTYTGPGPSAPNQSLGAIAISATATGKPLFPPVTNCARVGVPISSGLVDTERKNNRDCVTVIKPPVPNDVSVVKIMEGGEKDCAINSSCTFQIKVTNNSPWPFSGPVTFSDNAGIPMMVASTDLPCTPAPTAIPFSCTGNVTMPAGPSTQIYTVTGVMAPGAVAAGSVTQQQNCATIANPPPVPNSPPVLTSSQRGCVSYSACGFACHMTDNMLAKLSIEKKANATTCTPGGLCSYTFTFTNTSTTAYGSPLVFIDTMPAGSSVYVPVPPPSGGWSCAPHLGSPDQTKCLIRPANIPAGGSISLTLNFQISPGYNQSTLTNCSEFYNGSTPASLRRANLPNYGMTDTETLRKYLAMRGLSPPETMKSAASGGVSTLGPDDRSCTSVNITQPPNGQGDGSLTVKKQVVNNTPGVIPATPYKIAVACGTTTTNLSLLDAGSSTINNIPLNTACSVTETPPLMPAVCAGTSAVWTTTITPPSPITVTGSGTTVTVQNTLNCIINPPGSGKLTIKKVVEADLPTSMTFPVSVGCTDGSTHNVSVSATVGAEVSPLPSSASCTVTEGTVPIPLTYCPAGKAAHWVTTYAPSATVPIGTSATVTITNKLQCGVVTPAVQLLPPSVTPPVIPPVIPPILPPVVTPPVAGCQQGMVRRGGRCVEPPRPPSCRSPMTPNAEGACACPQGTVRRGQRCVEPPRPPSCRSPMTLNAEGACACPQGTVRRGQRCVEPPRPPSCRSPMTPNADGSCACPEGTMRRGQRCVEPPRPPVCQPPMRLNADGSCGCPPGTIRHGRSCEQPVSCEAPARPNGMGGCACPRGMTLQGRHCIELERPRPRFPTPDVIQPKPHLPPDFPRGGGRGGNGGDAPQPRGGGRGGHDAGDGADAPPPRAGVGRP